MYKVISTANILHKYFSILTLSIHSQDGGGDLGNRTSMIEERVNRLPIDEEARRDNILRENRESGGWVIGIYVIGDKEGDGGD